MTSIRSHIVRLQILILLGLFTACTTTEKTIKEDKKQPGDKTTSVTESAEQLQQLMASTRSKLSDVYFTQHHDIPDAFLQRDTAKSTSFNPFDGYRIQILSSRSVALADSISTQFRLWADTTFTAYTPKAYIFFKQPYYKVHVGDFQDRQRANELSQMIKQKYPDAWVVHDRINPALVPPDTVNITISKKQHP